VHGHPKRRAEVGVNVSWHRNKQKAFTFVMPKADTTFVLFQAMRQSGWKLTFWLPFFVFSLRQTDVSLAGQRNERKKMNIIEK